MSFVCIEAPFLKVGDTIVNLGEVINIVTESESYIRATVKAQVWVPAVGALTEAFPGEAEMDSIYHVSETVVVVRDLVPVGARARVKANDPSGRYKAGEVGEVLTNDYESKYAYRLLLPGEWKEMTALAKSIGVNDPRPAERVFYFYDHEVEAAA